MSSRQGSYQKHGYLIEEICQTYPDLNEDLQEKMLEFRSRFPSKYKDWYDYELLPALQKLQRRRHWSHSTTPESFRRPQHNGFHSRQDESYSRIERRRRQEEFSSRSESRIIQDEVDEDSCSKKFHLPHAFSKIISSRCVLFGQGKYLSGGLYPTSIPESQYVTNFDQLKDLIPFEDKKCFYEYLQTYIDQSTHFSEKLLYQLVLLHLKLKCQTEPNDVSELLLNEYKKIQGDQFLMYTSKETSRNSMSPHVDRDVMSREKFMSQPQDSFSTDSLAISREQFISQDLTREELMSQSMTREQFIAQDEDKTLLSQDEYKILHRLRKLLLNGSKHKALRWAIENHEWVSALFIASSMDENSYLSVCSMYIQSIPKNDPLRTCLQVQFGLDLDYQYSDDWGVHLAAILNNTQDANLITRFANILGGVKDICGQHFCYISGRIQPGSSGDRNAPYVLVGAENQLLVDQIPIESVMLTMAYDNTLPHLQYYKYYVALNYVKMGAYELSLCFLQNIAHVFLGTEEDLAANHFDLISYVYDLSMAIYNRVHTQHFTWINSLAELINTTQSMLRVDEMRSIPHEQSAPYLEYQHYENTQVYDETESSNYAYVSSNKIQDVDQAEPSIVQDPGLTQMPPADNLVPTMPMPQVEQVQSMSTYYDPSYVSNSLGLVTNDLPNPIEESQPTPDTGTVGVGTISLHSKFTFAEDKTDSPPQSASTKPPVQNESEDTAPKNVKPESDNTKSSGKTFLTGNWLGFLKIARPKNQMILPDDDKPSIVWDEDKKMWVGGSSGPSALPPPPKMTELAPAPAQHQPGESSAPVNNMSSTPMTNISPAPMNNMPLAQSRPGSLKMNAQNGYRKGKAKYVNVLANNR